jgi:all-trans-retinol 13,14-reductase
MHHDKSYRPDRLDTPYDAIIIGSGIGGLTVASLMSQLGKKVLVLERHYVSGGFTHTFKRKGYEWDVGVHYIGQVHRKNSMERRLFDALSDGELEWADMGEVYDRAVFPDQTYEFVKGESAWKARMKEYFPNEAKAIDRYVDVVNQCTGSARRFFMEKALPGWIGAIGTPLLSGKFHKYSDRTTDEVMREITSNQKLIGVLTTQYGDYGLPPKQSSFGIHAMVAKHYFAGGSYPVGGSGRIAETIIPGIQKNGGQVLVRADVQEILIKDNKAYGVRMADGNEILAPMIISAAGVPNTFGKLIKADCTARNKALEKLKKIPPSVAHVCLYIGLKHTDEELGLTKPNFWIYPGYDHDESVSRYLKDSAEEFPVTYISFPSAKDPAWSSRYPGTSTIEALGLAPYEWFAKWEDQPWKNRGEEYEVLKEAFAQRLLENVYQHVPSIKNKVDYYELSTPLSTKHFCNYDHGEIYGLDHTPHRFRQRWLRPRTEIKNLYLTGQDVASDGVTGAMIGGFLTASVIMNPAKVNRMVFK